MTLACAVWTNLNNIYYTLYINQNIQTNFQPLSYTTLYTENAGDVLALGDSSCSFLGALKLFQFYQGNANVMPSTFQITIISTITTFIEIASCISGCDLTLGFSSPSCVYSTTTPICSAGYYPDSISNTCTSTQPIYLTHTITK